MPHAQASVREGEVTARIKVALGAMSRRELREALCLKGDDNFRRRYRVPALEAGLLEMTIPAKPSSRLQRHRLTQRGVVVRASSLGDEPAS